MLNEWSDRPPPRPPRPLHRRGEFWLALFAAAVSIGLLAGFLGWLLG